MQSVQTLISGTITASGNSPSGQVPQVELNTIAVTLNVSAVTGTTPSITVSLQWSDDGVTWANASPADAFTAITAVTAITQVFTIKGQLWRLAYTVSGTTPSFTVTATGFFD